MQRFVDVIFVNPKGKYCVIWQQGKFWQLPSMRLTANAWVFKLVYKGSLDDIYVAKNQVITCERLAAILQTYQLPDNLSGVSATQFLAWWSANHRKVTQRAVAVTPAGTRPITQIKPIAQQILKRIQQAISPSTPATQSDVNSQNGVTPQDNLHHTPNKPASIEDILQKKQAAVRLSTSTPSVDEPPTGKPVTKIAEGFDIFDDLLHELNEEIRHHRNEY